MDVAGCSTWAALWGSRMAACAVVVLVTGCLRPIPNAKTSSSCSETWRTWRGWGAAGSSGPTVYGQSPTHDTSTPCWMKNEQNQPIRGRHSTAWRANWDQKKRRWVQTYSPACVTTMTSLFLCTKGQGWHLYIFPIKFCKIFLLILKCLILNALKYQKWISGSNQNEKHTSDSYIFTCMHILYIHCLLIIGLACYYL